MTGLSFGAYNAVVAYGLVLLIVIAASRFAQAFVRGVLAWFGKRDSYASFVLIVSHMFSMLVVGVLLSTCVPVADLPNPRSFLWMVLVVVGPPQLFFFVLELSRHVWRKRHLAAQVPK